MSLIQNELDVSQRTVLYAYFDHEVTGWKLLKLLGFHYVKTDKLDSIVDQVRKDKSLTCYKVALEVFNELAILNSTNMLRG
jgi:hypothetical protein